MPENLSTFAGLCVHRNQTKPSRKKKLSAVEERRNAGAYFCAELLCFLIAACAYSFNYI